MTAISAANQYPRVAVCDECIREQEAAGEDNQVVLGGTELVRNENESCHLCVRDFDD